MGRRNEKPLKITKQENGLYLVHFDKSVEIRTLDGKKIGESKILETIEADE
jgi:hypothetical protein